MWGSPIIALNSILTFNFVMIENIYYKYKCIYCDTY